MDEPIISVSGLRGIVGRSLSPEIALRYACALAAELGPGPLVMTRDGRTSGPMLGHAVASGLNAIGRDVIDAGIAATPTTGIAVRTKHAAGGIQISASHNPIDYNGIKLFGPDGRVLPAPIGQKVLQRYRSGGPTYVSQDKLGKTTIWEHAHVEHLQKILAAVDVEKIRAKRFSVVLDSNHGAGSLLGCLLLEALNCSVAILGGEPDGQFSHPPEPLPENLTDVLPMVRFSDAQVGFCQDPDADRLALIDETGRYIGEEYTLALCADHVLSIRPGPVVTNLSTSRMTADIAAQKGQPCHLSPVGEANVVDEMLARGAVLGGEGSGGVIDPRIGLVRDSFIGMALILEGLASRETPLSTWAAGLPHYEMIKQRVTFSREVLAARLAVLEQALSPASLDRRDGLRFDWPDGWLLVRTSNTEPIVRIMAEAVTAQLAASRAQTAQLILGARG